MKTIDDPVVPRRIAGRDARGAMTLVEILVVITILRLLMALLFPALNAARESSRASGCQMNLGQIGVGLATHATLHGTLCSGAFDWRYDGCVTEKGWVADLMAQGAPVGKMLCPSNPAQISETFNDLVTMDAAIDDCVDRLGSAAETAPDGSTVSNPCRTIATMTAGSASRCDVVEKQIYNKHYNTNYVPSWFLVRSAVNLNDSGQLKTDKATCPASLLSTHSTQGPLPRAQADTAAVSSSFIPLMGCGAPSSTLAVPVASLLGKPAVRTMTRGPVLKTTLLAPSPADGTPRGTSTGWWAIWNNTTLQDYRDFGPVHRGSCNILFADGGVRSVALLRMLRPTGSFTRREPYYAKDERRPAPTWYGIEIDSISGLLRTLPAIAVGLGDDCRRLRWLVHGSVGRSIIIGEAKSGLLGAFRGGEAEARGSGGSSGAGQTREGSRSGGQGQSRSRTEGRRAAETGREPSIPPTRQGGQSDSRRGGDEIASNRIPSEGPGELEGRRRSHRSIRGRSAIARGTGVSRGAISARGAPGGFLEGPFGAEGTRRN